MKKIRLTAVLLAALLVLSLAATAQENNDFYDNEAFNDLPIGTLEVGGEVARPGRVDLSGLPLRRVSVREAKLQGGKDTFIGAYVYQGYSLFDILRDRVVAKKNAKEFGSVIDLFVVVENARGDKAVFSWGEIYYPTALHRILLAAKVARIVPSLTKEHWPLPENSKIVAADDLLSERNIESPTRITVFSAPLSFAVEKGKSPLHAATCRIMDHGKDVRSLTGLPSEAPRLVIPTVFYGRGKGIHGITRFEGVPSGLHSGRRLRGFAGQAEKGLFRRRRGRRLSHRSDLWRGFQPERQREIPGNGSGRQRRRALLALPVTGFLFRPRRQGCQGNPFSDSRLSRTGSGRSR